MANGIMMQYFEWYLPTDCSLWNKITESAKTLADHGITALWLPPATKGQGGTCDVGYGTYDLYDLGEFDQKGTTRTKYGTKDEYLAAIRALHNAGIDVYADIVLDHKMGADYTEEVRAYEMNTTNRLQPVSGEETIEAWTGFDFPGRNNQYSDFKWNHTHFDGVDWDQRTHRNAIYNFVDAPWDGNVDDENANYDYLMGADLHFANQEVQKELIRFGKWYVDFTGVDGFRLDAIKHIDSTFFPEWLAALRHDSGRELFTVGEYWSADVAELTSYLYRSGECMSLFDVPLHFNFYHACHSSGYFDMSRIFENTLVAKNPAKAVTFVENHDTQRGQSLETVVEPWFKPLAYALILLRPQGYPCIFYGDYYGVPEKGEPAFGPLLDRLCAVRRDLLYGLQHDYLDDKDIIGWTLEGDMAYPDSGCAVVVDDGPGGEKKMYIGRSHVNCQFYDITGTNTEIVTIDGDGNGVFPVLGGNISVWVKESYHFSL